MALPPADPLSASIELADVDRFATLFRRTSGHPSAEQVQREYLDPGSYGVRVFTPDRIRDARHLAATIAANPDLYARALDTCLPIVRGTTAQLRATYLALHGLLPERQLPRIYLVMGANNSGGTAGPGAQVLGLEVLCRMADTPDRLREIMSGIYAHETVHTLQDEPEAIRQAGPLLGSVLIEGAADFIAGLVTGRLMDPARAAWAMPRRAALWRQFEADLVTTRQAGQNIKRGTAAGDALHRWVGNYGSAPQGWPGELGYWLGQDMWQRWYDRQPNKPAAIRAMLALDDPASVLEQGRFRPAR